MHEGLKTYLNFIKVAFDFNNEEMKKIEKAVEYFDNEISKVLDNYINEDLDAFSFVIYMAYLLSGFIDSDEYLEAFIKLMRELHVLKKEPSS